MLEWVTMIPIALALYRLTDRGAFRFHQMERHYTLAYIDRMWGLLRNVPFPKSMRI